MHVDKDKTSFKSIIFDEIFTVTHYFTEDKAHSLFYLLSLVAKNGQIINCRTLWGIGDLHISKFPFSLAWNRTVTEYTQVSSHFNVTRLEYTNRRQKSRQIANRSTVLKSTVERFAICQTVFTTELEKHTQEPHSLFEFANPLRN